MDFATTMTNLTEGWMINNPSSPPTQAVVDVGQAVGNGVDTVQTGIDSAAAAVANAIPSKTDIYSGAAILIVIMILVLLIIGKVETL